MAIKQKDVPIICAWLIVLILLIFFIINCKVVFVRSDGTREVHTIFIEGKGSVGYRLLPDSEDYKYDRIRMVKNGN